MALSASSLAAVAAQMRMPVAAMVALPTVVEAFARKAGMSVDRMIHELLNNEAMRDYAAQICIETYEVAR